MYWRNMTETYAPNSDVGRHHESGCTCETHKGTKYQTQAITQKHNNSLYFTTTSSQSGESLQSSLSLPLSSSSRASVNYFNFEIISTLYTAWQRKCHFLEGASQFTNYPTKSKGSHREKWSLNAHPCSHISVNSWRPAVQVV